MEELSAHLQDKEEKEAEAHLPPQYQPKKAKQQQHRAEPAGPSKNGHLRELPPNFERNVLLMAKQQAQRKLSAKPQAQRQRKLAHSQAQVAGQGLAAHSEAQRAGQAQGAGQAGTLPSSLEELSASLEELSALLPSVASDEAVSVHFSLCQALSPLLAFLEELSAGVEELSALSALAAVEELSALPAELILLEDLLLTLEEALEEPPLLPRNLTSVA